MRLKLTFAGGLFLVAAFSALHATQRPFREYPGFEYEEFPLPGDAMDKVEFVFGRLMYPPVSWVRRFLGDWRQGASYWTMDYPRSDRHFVQAIRRLTRIDARSVEQPVSLDDDDDVFYWPWLYAVEPGHWELTEPQTRKLREYLLKGGFLMLDDFHGTAEWEVFSHTMERVFPDRPIVEIENGDQIFHVLYELKDRYQVPGAQYLRSGRVYEYDGITARWRGIYDDRGRLMVAICHNMDLGDSWEHADTPQYPEKYSALGLRIGLNYVIYAMTH